MSPVKPFLKQNAGTVLLISILFASLALNVYQGLTLAGAFVPVSGIRAGAKFPISLPVLDAAGQPAVLNFAEDSRPTVVYVLSPLCGWCKRNEANIKALMADAGSRFRFIGLSVEGKNLKEYVADNRAPFPVYLVRSPEQIKSLHLDATPQTVVVGASGTVEKAWQGAYLESNRKEIEKYFDVKLPGLQETAAVPNANSKAGN